MGVLNSAVLINGNSYAWGNVTCIIGNVPLIGITKINYEKKQARENLYGFGNEPVARGSSRIEYTASIEIYREEMFRLIAAAPNNDILQIPPFTIVIQYGMNGQGDVVVPHQDTLYNVQFNQDTLSVSEGDAKINCPVELLIAGITHDF